ncbi:hypothetical protein AB204_06470 [Xenorhabdus khoisanae]|uniref:Uncharacterized protein n=2 Tax=Morganellaceae TaxID=1903414 RepID=A0A0J5IRS7_9GAMM|nr:hypothetical protein AB204_06470 [Xenorhabdus khoisanae]
MLFFICRDNHLHLYGGSIRMLMIRAKGKERTITPVQNTWDSFFLLGQSVADDFLSERPDQVTSQRESFDD